MVLLRPFQNKFTVMVEQSPPIGGTALNLSIQHPIHSHILNLSSFTDLNCVQFQQNEANLQTVSFY
jgi:hypothetical protein